MNIPDPIEPYNPYLPPAARVLREADDDTQCWRSGKRVIMRQTTGALPTRCVRCNAPAAEPTKMRSLYWHHSGWYFLVLINIILYALVAFFVRKKVKVAPGLCDLHKTRLVVLISIAWLLVVVSVGMIFYVSASGNDSELMAFAAGGLVLAVALALFMPRVRVAKISKELVYLSGFKRPFLDSLPELGSD